VKIRHSHTRPLNHLSDSPHPRPARLSQGRPNPINRVPPNDEHHPDPAIERPRHLQRRNGPSLRKEPEHPGQVPRGRVDRAPQPPRQHARHVLEEPAARDVCEAFEQAGPCGGEDLGDVYPRGLEERASEGGGGVPGTRGGVGEGGEGDDFTDEGEAVGVESGGGEA
jgi:hypothetical protein